MKVRWKYWLDLIIGLLFAKDDFNTSFLVKRNGSYLLEKKVEIKFERKWNPNYSQHKICKCGHPYHRHFDSYEDMRAVGCKHCDCWTFEDMNSLIDDGL